MKGSAFKLKPFQKYTPVDSDIELNSPNLIQFEPKQIEMSAVFRPSVKICNNKQPRSQGLSSYRPLGRARRDPGLVWSRVSQNLGHYN